MLPVPMAGVASGSMCVCELKERRTMGMWFAFKDENGVNLYYNIHTNESRRDMPLAIINEPIEENKGGGIAAGWSGSYGANMFSDPLDPTGQKGTAAKALETAI